jgi:hypothetical protein
MFDSQYPRHIERLHIQGTLTNKQLQSLIRWNEVMRVVKTPVGLPGLQTSLDGTSYIHAGAKIRRAAAAFVHPGAAVGGHRLEMTKANHKGWYGTHDTARWSERCRHEILINLARGQRLRPEGVAHQGNPGLRKCTMS